MNVYLYQHRKMTFDRVKEVNELNLRLHILIKMLVFLCMLFTKRK